MKFIDLRGLWEIISINIYIGRICLIFIVKNKIRHKIHRDSNLMNELRKNEKNLLIRECIPLQISITDALSGNSLFTYTFPVAKEKMGDEDLDSAIVNASCAIFEKTLLLGQVQEVRCEQGLMVRIYEKKHQLAFFLLTNQISDALLRAFKKLVLKFTIKFKSALKNRCYVSSFRGVSNLIRYYFWPWGAK